MSEKCFYYSYTITFQVTADLDLEFLAQSLTGKIAAKSLNSLMIWFQRAVLV